MGCPAVAEQAERMAQGPGSFAAAWLDALDSETALSQQRTQTRDGALPALLLPLRVFLVGAAFPFQVVRR